MKDKKTKVKVCFIARGLTRGGVQRFVLNLLEQFEKHTNYYNFYIITDRYDFINRFKKLNVTYIRNKNKLFWDYIKSFVVINRIKSDCIVYPKNIIPLTHILLKAKKINIIHDLAYFKKDINAYKKNDTLYMKLFMKLSCLIANKIVAISQSTKNDIQNILGIKKDKIIVVYEGVEKKFKKNKKISKLLLEKYNIRLPFIFYCGSLSLRKNILRALKAFDKIKEKISHNFYIASGKSWGPNDVKDYIQKNLSQRVKILPFLSEEELIGMYSLADLYIYPSLYEGFGLPILEAQACGCPVLTSNTSSCPEVANKGACIVNPYSEEEIKKGILKILSNKKYREGLMKKGFINVKKYSWKETAEKILRLCKEV